MSKPRTAQVCLRLPWLYDDGHGNRPKPGSTGLLTRTQLKAVGSLVRKARRQDLISQADADRELEEVAKGLAIIESGKLRDVGAYFPADCATVPDLRLTERRRQNKAARKARKRQRPKKKRKR